LRVWSPHSGELLRTIDENGQLPSALHFSTDDRLLAVAYEIAVYEKGAVKVFDVGSWKVRYDLATAFTMYTLVFSGQSSPCFLRLPQSHRKDSGIGSGKNLIEETCASAATVRKLISRSVASIVAEPLAPVALRSHFSLVRSASDPQHYLVHVFAPQM
jgi:hypothetical protein